MAKERCSRHRLTHRPERVHEDQWRALVYHWGTESVLKLSKKNTKIRKKKILHHRTGRKPFSVVRVEETNKNNGVPASRPQVWMAAYMKAGMSNSDPATEVMTQIKELTAQREGSSTESTTVNEEIFTQVMGPERPGRVRTFGLGPSPTDVFGGGYMRSQEQTRIFQTQLQEQLQQYQAQLELQMKETMEKQIEAMRTEMHSTIQAQQARMEYLESQLQAMGRPIAPSVAPSNPLHSRQVVDAFSSHHTAQAMSHPQQSHTFSSQEVQLSKKGKKKKKSKN